MVIKWWNGHCLLNATAQGCRVGININGWSVFLTFSPTFLALGDVSDY